MASVMVAVDVAALGARLRRDPTETPTATAAPSMAVPTTTAPMPAGTGPATDLGVAGAVIDGEPSVPAPLGEPLGEA